MEYLSWQFCLLLARRSNSFLFCSFRGTISQAVFVVFQDLPMASPPLLDFDSLLAPIPGDNPAGGAIPFEIREKLEEGRKEINLEDFDKDDPARPTEAKRADWPGIVRVAQETLTKTSKDLLVSARLTEALVKQYGFAGLRDGLHLMRLLVERCWDRLNPTIEDGDLEVRAGPFNWLADAEKGARFPNSLRKVPLIVDEKSSRGDKAKKFSWMEWRLSQEGKGAVTRGDFEKAILATPRAQFVSVEEDINQSVNEIGQLLQTLNGKMGPLSPGLIDLRGAVEDCRKLVKQMLGQKGEEGGEVGGNSSVEEAPSSSGMAKAGSREQAYRQLAQAAAVLRQLEPHSPIPYLIQRAVELGAMPFPQLMRALIREQNVLNELTRELGIKEAGGTPPTSS
jgi:type VI secretion system protein ImpA